MKFNFRKISALATSALLIGMTAGVAAAANYPAPLVQSCVGDFAVVYGARGASTDQGQANLIASQLLALSTSSVGLGSEAFRIKGTNDEFNLGDTAASVRGTIRKDQMPILLADGTYLDDGNTEFKFTQKIDLSSNLLLKHFRDSDLDNVPTIGMQLTSSGTDVLNYTMEFQTRPDFTAAKLETTTLKVFGKEYFISSVGANSLTLLDSAITKVLNQGETATLSVNGNSYTVNIQAISTSGVVFVVNGQTTNRLNTGDTYKLPDGSHIGVKDFQQAQFAGDTAFAEFSLGAGKLVLTEGSEVELNDDTVEGLIVVSSSMNDTGKFKGIKLQWKTDDRAWVTPQHEMVQPGFEAFKLSMTEFFIPSEEIIRVEDSGTHIDLTIPLKGGSVTLPLLYHNESTAAIKGIGESDDKLLLTANTPYVTFNKTANHYWFVASYEGSKDAYSEVFRISSVNSNNETTLTAIGSGTTYSNVVDGGTIVAGDIELKLDVIARAGSSDFTVNVTNPSSSTINFRRIYSTDGLRIYLPVEVETGSNKGDFGNNATGTSTGHNATSWYLFADEQDKDGALANGGQIRLTLTPRSADDDTIHVSAVTVNATAGSTTGTSFGTGSDPTLRVQSTDEYIGYVTSDLATKITWDKSGDEYIAALTYHGEEAYGKVYLSSTDVTDGTPELGSVLVTDAEVSTVQGRNLIVVGGSCINSVAAALVGGAYCTTAWQSATGVGAGQFLIQSYTSPYAGSKVALLVAGYNAEDTVNAATYVRNRPQPIDSAVGKKYIGTSATSAQLVVQ